RGRPANNRTAWHVPLQPVAGDRVADRQREKAERSRKHDDVQHERILAMPCRLLTEYEVEAHSDLRLTPGLAWISCHLPHMFARRTRSPRYRNFITPGGSMIGARQGLGLPLAARND